MLMPRTKPSVKPASYTIRYLLLLFIFTAAYSIAGAQVGQRLRIYNSWDEVKLYNNDTIAHTVWKPVIYTDSLVREDRSQPWLKRKFFQEHLLQVQNKDINIYGDIVIDEYVGKSNRYAKMVGAKNINVKTPSVDTRGFEVSGNIGSKIYFETNFYENQGKFGGYIDSFIRQYKVIPGQASYKNIGDGSGFDFSSSSARVTYIPNKTLLFDLGYGKNFIGDGYRSLLMSDWSVNYPYFRVALTFGKFQYSAMWSQYVSHVDGTLDNHAGFYRKWAQTYVLDWNAAPGFNISLFESVIWPDQLHGPDRQKDISASLLSPVIFLHGSKSPSGVSNNDILGLNAKLKVYERSYLYGQFVVNQFGSGWKNRTGFQLGVRSGDVFELRGLNVDAEFNTVRPYTYAGSSPDVSYSNADQGLAHPLGANFREGIVTATYTYKKWWLRGELFVASYGVDTGQSNYGHNIFALLPSQSPVTGSVSNGQGVSTNLVYLDLRAAYIINPLSNLRLETGITYRRETNSLSNFKDLIFYIGIRTTFRSLLYDF